MPALTRKLAGLIVVFAVAACSPAPPAAPPVASPLAERFSRCERLTGRITRRVWRAHAVSWRRFQHVCARASTFVIQDRLVGAQTSELIGYYTTQLLRSTSATYPIAVGNVRIRADGAAFVAFVESPPAQTILARWGFLPPTEGA
jgi:hypothetical protein